MVLEPPLPLPFFVLPLPRPGDTGDPEECGEAEAAPGERLPSVRATMGRYPRLSLISLKRFLASKYVA